MRLSFARAATDDAPDIAAVHTAVATDLTEHYGRGHWSTRTTERGVLATMRMGAHVWVARRGRTIVATWTLGTRKPWAIDRSYFDGAAQRVLYLTGMAVQPEMQRQGVGRKCVEAAVRAARAEGADAIHLDAYDVPGVGAGDFYVKCGFREVKRASYKGTPHRYFERRI